MKLSSVLWVACVFLSLPAAWASNVYDQDPYQVRMLRVTQNFDHTLSFESCEKTAPSDPTPIRCVQIGNQTKYTLEELSSRRHSLNMKGLGLSVLDTVIVAGIVWTGAGVGMIAGGAVVELVGGSMASMALIPVAGFAGGALAAWPAIKVALSDTLNPFKKFSQARKIKEIQLNVNRDVFVKNVGEYIEVLEKALNAQVPVSSVDDVVGLP